MSSRPKDKSGSRTSSRKNRPATENAKPNKKKGVFLIASAGLVVCLGVLALVGVFGSRETGGRETPSPTLESAAVFRYPQAEFADGKARFYSYRTDDGLTIRYFILKSSDGIIRAAFDACDVCWRAGKGYVQVGDFMVCRNCGRRFASVRVNEVKGGCNPAPLLRRTEGSDLVITRDHILEGRNFFDFAQRG